MCGGTIAAIFALTKHRVLSYSLTIVILLLLFYPNLKLFKPQTYLNVEDSHYTSDEFIKWKISKTSFEFVPKGVKTKTEISEIEKKEITQVAISRDQIATAPYKIVSGEGEVEIKRNMPGSLILKTKSERGMELQLNTFEFPGWEVKLDGTKVIHQSDNDLKLLSVTVPSGEHTLQARFKNTPIRSLANFITLISIAFILLLEFKMQKK
ncbi:hypothetical protein IH980_04630 [Patescibacteria group bacterium]|nr:hypothetical protein [Patescibacteria group bacterium]